MQAKHDLPSTADRLIDAGQPFEKVVDDCVQLISDWSRALDRS
jgi:hypothetical protein